MNLSEVKSLVMLEVARCIRDKSAPISVSTILVGENGNVDSITLIELCVGLEDRASELGFEFDWTSDAAMSRSRSMFSTVESLSQEFYDQLLASQ